MTRLLVFALLVGGCGGGSDVTFDAPTIDAAVTTDSRSPDASIDASPAVEEGQVFLGEARNLKNESTTVVIAMFMNGPLYVTTASADGCDAIQDMQPSSPFTVISSTPPQFGHVEISGGAGCICTS